MTISLITGGSRGIGRATALALAARGNDVVITYASNAGAAKEVLAEVEKRGRRAWALKLDVGQTSTFDAFIVELKKAIGTARVDHLVNNAGIGSYAPFATADEASFDEVFNVHVKGPFFLTQKLLPLLADGGRIVNLSSGLSRYALAGLSLYSTAKGAIDTLTRSLALELGPRRISVNVVAPGGIVTDIGGGMMKDEGLQKQVIADTPYGRMGQPEDIAGIIAMLCAPESGWMTGQRLEATGGFKL